MENAFQQAVMTSTLFFSALKYKCTVKTDLLTLDLKGFVLIPEQNICVGWCLLFMEFKARETKNTVFSSEKTFK